MGKKIVLDLKRCPANHACPAAKVCPMDALHQVDDHHAPEINYHTCVACGACVRVCGKKALRIIEE